MAKARKKRSKKPLFGKLFQVRVAIKKTDDITDFPVLGRLVFLLGGVLLMLTAVDVIHLLDPSRLNAPKLVVLGVGFLFFCVGVLSLIAKYRYSFPALYMLIAALMCTTFAAVFTWVALWAKGPFGGSFSVGPLAVFNDSHDLIVRIGFGIGAIAMISLSCLAWGRWWLAINGEKIDLN